MQNTVLKNCYEVCEVHEACECLHERIVARSNLNRMKLLLSHLTLHQTLTLQKPTSRGGALQIGSQFYTLTARFAGTNYFAKLTQK